MMPSDNLNWSLAILLSLLLFSSLLLQRGAQMGIERSSVVTSPMITRLTFSQNTETVPDVLPVTKPKTRPQVKPIKRVKPKAVATKKIKPLKKIVKQESVKQAATQLQPQRQQVSVSADSVLQQKREQYLQKLLSHIESFKFYPRSARRRSIEGQVIISLKLNDDGSYELLMLDGERSILINATRSALESAIPLPVPAEDIEISRKVKFAMAYTLN